MDVDDVGRIFERFPNAITKLLIGVADVSYVFTTGLESF